MSRVGRAADSHRRRVTFAIAIFILIASLPLQAQFVERVDVSIANVDVVVTDGEGNPVRGLTREDFEVYENGKLQTITNFSAIEAQDAEALIAPDTATAETAVASEPSSRRLIVLFLDIDDIEPIRRRQFFDGLSAYVHSSFREGDLFTLLTWNRRLRVVTPPISSRTQLEALMKPFASSDRWSESDLMRRAAQVSLSAAEAEDEIGSGGTSLLSPGMDDLLDPAAEAAFQEFITAESRCSMIRRKAGELRSLITSLVRVDMQKVLLFASDDFSIRPSRDCLMTAQIDALADTANAYGMTIHAFHPSGVRNRPVGYAVDRNRFGRGLPATRAPAQGAVEAELTYGQSSGLFRLAERTGGLVAIGAGTSARVLSKAASELDNYYSIGYRFSAGNEDKPRKIKVRTKDRTHRVRSRQTVVRLSEKARLRDDLTANLYLPPSQQSDSPAFDARVDRITRDGRYSTVHLELFISARDLLVLASANEQKRGSFSVFVVGGKDLGDASPVAEMEQTFEAVPGAEGSLTYEFGVRVRPDTRRLSVAVRDNLSGDTSTKLIMIPRTAEVLRR